LHEITNTSDDYPLTDFRIEQVIDELLPAIGDTRLGAGRCSRRQPAISRNGRVPNDHAPLVQSRNALPGETKSPLRRPFRSTQPTSADRH
jgi:hypothetical protein